MGFFLHPSLYISTISLSLNLYPFVHLFHSLFTNLSILSLSICRSVFPLCLFFSFDPISSFHTKLWDFVSSQETSYYTQGNGPLYIERKHGILKGNNTERKNTKMISLIKAKDNVLRVGQRPRWGTQNPP